MTVRVEVRVKVRVSPTNRMQQQKRKLISQAHPNDHAAQKKQQKKLATPQRYDFKSGGALESR